MTNFRPMKGFSKTAAIIVVAIILLIVGAFFMMRKPVTTSAPSSATEEPNGAMTREEVSTDETGSTITDLVAKGQSLECDFTLPSSTESPNPFGTGKLYTTGNKGRSMMTGNASGMNMEANAIYKDDTAYSWVTVAGTTMGFKFDKAKMESMGSELTPQQKQQGEQFRAKMNFNCKPWTPDESKFTLPTGVEFK